MSGFLSIQSRKHTIQNNHYDSLEEHLPVTVNLRINQIYCACSCVSTIDDDPPSDVKLFLGGNSQSSRELPEFAR